MQEMLTIIVPVYNEMETLPEVAPKIIQYATAKQWPIIFVDDGSKDGSGKYLDTLQVPLISVLHHKVNRGYGGAIKTGIQHVSMPYCVTLDADGQHTLEDIERVFRFALEKDADMVVGDRGLNGDVNTYR